jgi:NAD(P)-dependent dehydrogenase (short-subunit alcohol dehydrogenase family)
MIKTQQTPVSNGFNGKTTVKDVIKGINLKGMNAIVTGGYAGMGLEITRALSGAGANVTVPARNLSKAHKTLDGIPNIEVDFIDLTVPDSIDGFAKRFIDSDRPLHILINNAGVMTVPLKRDSRGNISQFSTNNLGHFQLTARLWGALKKANGARVVSVSSRAHRLSEFNFNDPNYEQREYDKTKAYAESKTGNVLFTIELDCRGKNNNIRAFAVHPGLVPHTRIGKENSIINKITTRLFVIFAKFSVKKIKDENGKSVSNENKSFFKNVSQGAATAVWCAVSPQLNGNGGVYCEDVNISEAVTSDSLSEKGVRPWAIDPKIAKRFWSLCETFTGVEFITK